MEHKSMVSLTTAPKKYTTSITHNLINTTLQRKVANTIITGLMQNNVKDHNATNHASHMAI